MEELLARHEVRFYEANRQNNKQRLEQFFHNIGFYGFFVGMAELVSWLLWQFVVEESKYSMHLFEMNSRILHFSQKAIVAFWMVESFKNDCGIRFSGHSRIWQNKLFHYFLVLCRVLILVYIYGRALPDLVGTVGATVFTSEDLIIDRYEDKQADKGVSAWINWAFFQVASWAFGAFVCYFAYRKCRAYLLWLKAWRTGRGKLFGGPIYGLWLFVKGQQS